MTPVDTLSSVVGALMIPGRGILAADESLPTISRRFKAAGIPITEETRRSYRELLFTAPGIGSYVSGAILFDETLRQLSGGLTMVEVLERRSIVPGIKVDLGAVPMPGFPGERMTQGLDGLRERLAAYQARGARFTKWRAVLSIGGGRPGPACLEANAQALALFAGLSQEAGLVPLVEPELLMEGDHTLGDAGAATGAALAVVFDALRRQRVVLEEMILKTGMVLPGARCGTQADAAEVAAATLRCLRRCVPAAVGGIVFLSGGQEAVTATERLNAICAAGSAPWRLGFSFGRALQEVPLATWGGHPGNGPRAQEALLHRARCNSLALRGAYSALVERGGDLAAAG